MKFLLSYLQKKYNYSNYQIAQLNFLFKTIFSELSKIIIMGIIFYKFIPQYICALFFMLLLRSTSGGLHIYTYLGCLATSVSFIGLSLLLYTFVPFPLYIKGCLLLISILICHLTGPVTSKYRPPRSGRSKTILCNLTCIFIFIYTLFMYIIPDNPYIQIGFWVIILHTFQLRFAKYIRKEAV